MPSLTERAVIVADDIGLKVIDEARQELTGRTTRKWAVAVLAFVVGAAVVLIAIGFRKLETAETMGGSEEDSATASDPALTGETRWWRRRAANARAGLSAAWRFPARS
jgi:hypothetical protein